VAPPSDSLNLAWTAAARPPRHADFEHTTPNWALAASIPHAIVAQLV
jgi:hypothetical protein